MVQVRQSQKKDFGLARNRLSLSLPLSFSSSSYFLSFSKQQQQQQQQQKTCPFCLAVLVHGGVWHVPTKRKSEGVRSGTPVILRRAGGEKLMICEEKLRVSLSLSLRLHSPFMYAPSSLSVTFHFSFSLISLPVYIHCSFSFSSLLLVRPLPCSQYCLSDKPDIRPFEPEKTCLVEYPITTYQPTYFVSDSFEEAKEKMRYRSLLSLYLSLSPLSLSSVSLSISLHCIQCMCTFVSLPQPVITLLDILFSRQT